MTTFKNFKLNLIIAFFTLSMISCSSESSSELFPAVDEVSNAAIEKGKDDNFTASLKGRNEVPPVQTKGSGVTIVRISKDRNSIYYKLIVSNLKNVVGAHFHMAPAGENGPVVAFLFTGNVANQNGILSEGVITADDITGPLAGLGMDALIERIRNGRIYVNVHTSDVPTGAIRGQL